MSVRISDPSFLTDFIAITFSLELQNILNQPSDVP
jgi:hypothetical protein